MTVCSIMMTTHRLACYPVLMSLELFMLINRYVRQGAGHDGQAAESMDSMPMHCYLFWKADAGSVPDCTTNNEAPTVLGWGFFLICWRQFPRVCADPCGSLRTSPVGHPTHLSVHSSLSGPFFSPVSLPTKHPKSAKAACDSIANQHVTRGRIERLDCSIGYPEGTRALPASHRTCSLSEIRIYFRT